MAFRLHQQHAVFHGPVSVIVSCAALLGSCLPKLMVADIWCQASGTNRECCSLMGVSKVRLTIETWPVWQKEFYGQFPDAVREKDDFLSLCAQLM